MGKYKEGWSFEITWVMLMQACARKMGLGQAYETKLWAAIEGTLVAINLRWTKLVLKSDSAYVISVFQNKLGSTVDFQS